MTELDDKLRAIAEQAFYPKGKGYDSPDDFVAAIKQVFAEAGYIKPEDDIEVKDNVLRIRDLQLMTGQQFYERFRKEAGADDLLVNTLSPTNKYIFDMALEVARRAAGLPDA